MNANRLIGYREAYEDHCADFMDDLFGDVEQSLRLRRERHRPDLEHQEEPMVVSLVKVDVESIDLPIVPELALEWIEPAPPVSFPPVVEEKDQNFDRFFLGTALVSMVLGTMALVGQVVLFHRPIVSESAPVAPPAPEAVEFSSEIKTAFRTATPPAPAPVVTPAPPQTVVQYVPIYTPPPVVAPTYREPVRAARLPEVEPMPAPQNATTTLSGLFMLEPNDRSYALIESNGNVQSVAVGGAVGSTGWRLKSVTQETAVLERDGQVRSVSVGQRF